MENKSHTTEMLLLPHFSEKMPKGKDDKNSLAYITYEGVVEPLYLNPLPYINHSIKKFRFNSEQTFISQGSIICRHYWRQLIFARAWNVSVLFECPNYEIICNSRTNQYIVRQSFNTHHHKHMKCFFFSRMICFERVMHFPNWGRRVVNEVLKI